MSDTKRQTKTDAIEAADEEEKVRQGKALYLYFDGILLGILERLGEGEYRYDSNKSGEKQFRNEKGEFIDRYPLFNSFGDILSGIPAPFMEILRNDVDRGDAWERLLEKSQTCVFYRDAFFAANVYATYKKTTRQLPEFFRCKEGDVYALKGRGSRVIGWGKINFGAATNPIEIFIQKEYRSNGYGTWLFGAMLSLLQKQIDAKAVQFVFYNGSTEGELYKRIVANRYSVIFVGRSDGRDTYLLPLDKKE